MVSEAYFEFEATYDSLSFGFRALIIDVTMTHIVVNETYSEGNESFSLVTSYSQQSRERAGQPGYYAWWWIDSGSLQNGTLRAADRVLYLQYSNATHHAFYGEEATGNSSWIWFKSDDSVLDSTADIFVAGAEIVESQMIRVGEGRSGLDSPDEEPRHEGSTDGGAGIVAGTQYHYYPPFGDGWGYTYMTGYGIHDKHASWSANRYTGYMYNDALAWVGPGFGGARADAMAYMRDFGPGAFRARVNGIHRLIFHHTLGGSALTTTWLCGWWGGSHAEGEIRVSITIYDFATGYIVPTEVSYLVYYTNFNCGLSWGDSWNQEFLDLSYYANLYAGRTYTFIDRTYSRHLAAAVGAGSGGSHGHFSSTLTHITIIEP